MKPYTLGIYEKAMPAELSWKEKMETAKAAGYDFIEISIDETEEKLVCLIIGDIGKHNLSTAICNKLFVHNRQSLSCLTIGWQV